MEQLTPEEVSAVKRWLAKRAGTVGIDADTHRVYNGVCEYGESLDEVYATWAVDAVDPLTRERVQQAWENLVGMAQEMRERDSK
jgi:hypothetical protein